jgi:hypothetical protein
MKTNIFFTTSSDGLKREGIGATAQYQIICYILSKIYNTQFYFTGFKNLHHYQYFNITQEEWDQEITEFFNFKVSPLLEHDIIDIEDNFSLNVISNQKHTIILNLKYIFLLKMIY